MAKNFQLVNILAKTKPSNTIYLANSKQTNDVVIVKQIDLDDENIEYDDLFFILNELTRLKQLRHENITHLINCFTHDTSIWCIYPYMLYGTCKDILDQKCEDGFNESSLQLISKSMLSALEYIHSKHIIHRCICPENIYISHSGHVYLSGFKFSVSLIDQGNLVKRLHDYPSFIQDYLNYMSPEVLQQNLIGYNTKSDIYSFGVTICELANGVNPFVGCEKTQMLLEKLIGSDIGLWDRTILNDESKIKQIEVCAKENPKLIEALKKKLFSDTFCNFVDLCVTKNYQVRLNATQMLAHPFFKKLTRRSLIELLEPIKKINELNSGTTDYEKNDSYAIREEDEEQQNQSWIFD